MWDDAVLLQGRQTKRKWKEILILVFAAAFAVGAAWAMEHQEFLGDSWEAFWTRCNLKSDQVWNSIGCSTEAEAFYLEDAIVYVEDGQICVADINGNVQFRWDTLMEEPQYAQSKSAAVFYEAGGKDMFLLGADGIVHVSSANELDAAAVSDCGTAAVVTSGSGYLTVTKCYDSSGRVTKEIGLTDAAMVMMTFLRETDTLVSCLVTNQGSWVLRLDKADDTIEIPIESDIIYDLKPCGKGVALWTSDGIALYSQAGERIATYECASDSVIDWDSDTFAAVLTRSGTVCQLITVAENGIKVGDAGQLAGSGELSVCGNTVCVLDREELLFYDKSCELLGQSAYGASAQTVQAIHGGAVLFGDGEFMCCLIS